MTPHDHREFVPGCYRCELSRDEVDDDLLSQIAERRGDRAFMERLARITEENREALDRRGGLYGRSDYSLIRRRKIAFHGAVSVLDTPDGRWRFTLASDFRSWLAWRHVVGGWRQVGNSSPTLALAREAAALTEERNDG